MPQANPLKQIVVKQKEGKPVGIYSRVLDSLFIANSF